MLKTMIFTFMLLTMGNALAETVYLTSLSWPPYSDKKLDEQGASVAVAKAAFKAEGHELVVDFFPWSRAVKLTNSANSKYVGYFPEYRYETNEFIFSEPMGSGPLALMQNRSRPINFIGLESLKGLKLGVVQDYVNTKELDEMIANGAIDGKPVLSDVVNIKKVASNRIDSAVIDVNVFNFLLNSDKSLKRFEDKVELHKKLLANKMLFVAFKNDSNGKKWQQIYNAGLKKIDIEAIMSKHLKGIE